MGIVGGAEGSGDSKEFVKFAGGDRRELGAPIRDDFVRETESFVHIIEKEGGSTKGINSLVTRDENYPLCKAMVYHNHDRVKTSRGREISDKVDGDLFKGTKGGGGDRHKGGKWDGC